MTSATPSSVGSTSLDTLLGGARLRLRLHGATRVLLRVSTGACAVGIALVLWRVAGQRFGLLPVFVPPLVPALVVLTVAGPVAAVLSLLRTVPVRDVAREVDRRMGLDDRAATALALVNGSVSSPLAEVVLAESDLEFSRASKRLGKAFPAGLSSGEVRLLKGLGVAFALLVASVILAHLLGGLGLPGVFDLGIGGGPTSSRPGPTGPVADEGADPGGDTPGPVAGETDESGPQPGRTPPPPDEKTPDEKTPDEEAPGAGVRARLLSTQDAYPADEPVMVVVSATPTVDLARETVYRVLFVVDGETFDGKVDVTPSPDRPEGEAVSIDLRHVDDARERLGPGKHKVRAMLVPEDGGVGARTNEVEFTITPSDDDGGDDGGGGGESGGGDQEKPAPGEQPDENPKPSESPEPEPRPQDPTEPPPPPPPPEPDSAAGGGLGGDGEPPPDVPAPPLDVGFEKKLVIPLFGEGEEVTKHGPRLVLVPGGGQVQPPRRRPLAEALPEARKRAERLVDRSDLRKEDLDLIRRYFERLARWVR